MAELSAERLRALPGSWSYGISQGGRIFFINEEAKSTTWLHPLTGEAVITGHRRSADLPTGWEEAYTFEGARYYVNGIWMFNYFSKSRKDPPNIFLRHLSKMSNDPGCAEFLRGN
ncbi:LOW QUALITY PROTEIN: pleckstrin homology domain-containing family A member 5-like [Corvus cornix cornix]|uniref:LOW QUALITY PROTEIN: pleckstrin homology domain-containing family A member 5-like n=1 Tax=Corvus cornix cornix TaxID=932674 RepID=UPI00194E850D|nr:LOW QUALITY PROTEIN: pleckstrin homology domain-containing family A member 5-like [Corvus cornix cornix]